MNDTRSFSLKGRKHGWFHRINPFNALLKRHLAKNLGAPEPLQAPIISTVLNQGSTEFCGEYEACAEQTAVDNIVYDVPQFLNAVCAYLGIPLSLYTGSDVHTLFAASIDPGLTPQGQTTPTVKATAVIWIHPESGMDLYDTIQSYVENYRRPVAFGTTWYADWDTNVNGLVPSGAPTSQTGGHCSMLNGKVVSGAFQGVTFPEPDRMVNQNSWGTDAPGSVNGFYLFPRDVVNDYLCLYGAGMRIFSNDQTVKLLGQLSMYYVKLIDLLHL
jgi:hypothetical protein